jgi:hypothetical protein
LAIIINQCQSSEVDQYYHAVPFGWVFSFVCHCLIYSSTNLLSLVWLTDSINLLKH